MAIDSSVLAGKILWAEEPGGLMEPQRVRHDWMTEHSLNMLRDLMEEVDNMQE